MQHGLLIRERRSILEVVRSSMHHHLAATDGVGYQPARPSETMLATEVLPSLVAILNPPIRTVKRFRTSIFVWMDSTDLNYECSRTTTSWAKRCVLWWRGMRQLCAHTVCHTSQGRKSPHPLLICKNLLQAIGWSRKLLHNVLPL